MPTHLCEDADGNAFCICAPLKHGKSQAGQRLKMKRIELI